MEPQTIGEQIKKAFPQYAKRDALELGTKYLQKYGGAVTAIQSGRLKLTDIPEAQRVGVSIGLNAANVNKPLTTEQEKQEEKLTNVRQSADILKKNLEETEAQGPLMGRGAQVLNFLSGGGAAPEVADYEALRKSLIGPLARAISGEVGVLTDKDISRAEGLLPKVSDAKKLRENKFKNLMEIISVKSKTSAQTPSGSRFTIEAVE